MNTVVNDIRHKDRDHENGNFDLLVPARERNDEEEQEQNLVQHTERDDGPFDTGALEEDGQHLEEASEGDKGRNYARQPVGDAEFGRQRREVRPADEDGDEILQRGFDDVENTAAPDFFVVHGEDFMGENFFLKRFSPAIFTKSRPLF